MRYDTHHTKTDNAIYATELVVIGIVVLALLFAPAIVELLISFIP
jgi:hypothetical protein